MSVNMNLPGLLLLCLGCGVASSYIITAPHMWTRLILTHHWPTTFCDMEHCHANFSYWTLHGLWPDNGQNCNNSWPFNTTLVEDLVPDMRKSWPDLLKPASQEFWKYEWNKHGTCAAKSPTMDSQHKYFSKALELYHKMDLTGALSKSGIVPSEDYYKFDDIEGAFFNFYQVTPKIQCVSPGKEEHAQLLVQLEICFNAEFQLENCEKTVPLEGKARASEQGLRKQGPHVCDHTRPVYYPPVKTQSRV